MYRSSLLWDPIHNPINFIINADTSCVYGNMTNIEHILLKYFNIVPKHNGMSSTKKSR
jgi:hypothetical protein